LFAALRHVHRPIVITYPNADTRHHAVIKAIRAFVAEKSNAVAIKNLGTQDISR
jgi:hypothetical protein